MRSKTVYTPEAQARVEHPGWLVASPTETWAWDKMGEGGIVFKTRD